VGGEVVAVTAVTDWLEREGVSFELIPHPRAESSIAEALALGVSGDEVVKAVLLHTAAGHVLLAVPGSRRLDMHRVREAVEDRHARLATEDELTRDFPSYELGALPPLGGLLGVRLLVDSEVFERESVVFAAGTRTESVRVRAVDVLPREPSTSVPLTRGPGEDEAERVREASP
jgi:Ala-tRNA(Pro) deacylase